MTGVNNGQEALPGLEEFPSISMHSIEEYLPGLEEFPGISMDSIEQSAELISTSAMRLYGYDTSYPTKEPTLIDTIVFKPQLFAVRLAKALRLPVAKGIDVSKGGTVETVHRFSSDFYRRQLREPSLSPAEYVIQLHRLNPELGKNNE